MHAFEKGEKHSRKNSKLDMIIIRCSNMKSAVVVVVMIVCVQQVFVEQQQGAGFFIMATIIRHAYTQAVFFDGIRIQMY